MNTLLIVRSSSHDPWHNLALEEYLTTRIQSDADLGLLGILYLWQNQNTVVIGRNQNAWRECQTALLENEGGRLARRTTGGGAVYHDLGNLNFSLISPRRSFCLDDNFDLIISTVKEHGINAERTGRNDITADGRKFSGNAFSLRAGAGLHHGTLLVNSDFARLSRYLTVAPAKLQAKGVASVRSRVVNLVEMNPLLTVQSLAETLEQHFVSRFQRSAAEAGHPKPFIAFATENDFAEEAAFLAAYERFASWQWRFGESLRFDAHVETRMDWGMVEIGLLVEQGRVAKAAIYTDALDCDFVEILISALQGCIFRSAALADSLRLAADQDGGFGPSREKMVFDLAELILEQGW